MRGGGAVEIGGGLTLKKWFLRGGWIGKSEQRKCEGDINEYYTELDIYFLFFEGG